MANETNDRQQQIANVWLNVPTAPIVLSQDLQEGKQSVHKEDVTINKLWAGTELLQRLVEEGKIDQDTFEQVNNEMSLLRGHAHKWVMIDAQKRTKASISARAEAQKEGKAEVPEVVTVQDAYDTLIRSFPAVQGVTAAAGGGGKKADPVAALAAKAKDMDGEQKIAVMLATGLIDEATAAVLRKQLAKAAK